MEISGTRVDAGAVIFALHYTNVDGGKVGARSANQGVTLQVAGDVEGRETELLRFDCFDENPHYHYGPENKNEAIFLDSTTAGNPLGWALTQMRTMLPTMLTHAGYEEVAGRLDSGLAATKLDELETLARDMAIKERNTVTHNRGNLVIEAGVIRFGLEFRDLANDRGQAIHVLGDVAGQEIELLAFDCFERAPHYHYGPRNRNERMYWDTTTVPDTLRWTLDQFKGGKLPAMIQRAGYPGIVAGLDEQLLQSKIIEVEARVLEMAKANAR